MEGSRIDLKTFLGLAKPNQFCKVPESKYQAGFGAIISGQNPQTLMIPIYSTIVLYDEKKKEWLIFLRECARRHELR